MGKFGTRNIRNYDVATWVTSVKNLCKPDSVFYCDGSPEEAEYLIGVMLASGMLTKLKETPRPNSYLARSHPSDVARLEDRTFIATRDPADAGPTNKWADPCEMKRELIDMFDGAMRGRTMYVVPFVMAPPDSPLAKVGVQITDSPYVALSMGVMTRMGEVAARKLERDPLAPFVRCHHSVGAPLTSGTKDVPWPCEPDVNKKFVVHFTEEYDGDIWSYGSGYGGNALLGKKCLALRIASAMARREGWLAEHMLILAVRTPEGKKHYIAAAFPSACGKTNLAMLRSVLPDWEVTTLGDDIAWIRVGEDGRLYAVNPESGFFGVAPGTSDETNPNCMRTISGHTIFTNVALTPWGDVWWEGMSEEPPPRLIDWQGNEWTSNSGTKAAHPNARFTVHASRSPTIDPDWENPEGVPLSAIIFGGRRADTVPLVREAFNWEHGVFFGSTCASETTAAAAGKTGVLRRDPFAMLPFLGYNIGDYFAHWLSFAERTDRAKLPKIFFVNWFRRDENGKYLWPGFSDNIRVLKWMVERVEGRGVGISDELGVRPAPLSIDLSGLPKEMQDIVGALTSVDFAGWREEVNAVREWYATLGERHPKQLTYELDQLEYRLR